MYALWIPEKTPAFLAPKELGPSGRGPGMEAGTDFGSEVEQQVLHGFHHGAKGAHRKDRHKKGGPKPALSRPE